MGKRENIGWIDSMRVLACFLVVFSHSCDAFVAQFDNDYTTFLWGCSLGSLVRPCVPLFVMMTGVLLLPPTGFVGTMADFCSKRLRRIAVPLIFWSLALPVAYFLYLNFVASSNSPFIDMSSFTWEMTLRKMYTFIFNFNYRKTT